MKMRVNDTIYYTVYKWTKTISSRLCFRHVLFVEMTNHSQNMQGTCTAQF